MTPFVFPALRRKRSTGWESAILAMATEGTAHQEALVSFKNFSDERLAGVLLDTGSSETAILCHGYADQKNGFHLPRIAKALAQKSWSSFRYSSWHPLQCTLYTQLSAQGYDQCLHCARCELTQTSPKSQNQVLDACCLLQIRL